MSVLSETYRKLLHSFNENKVEYMLIGGHAAIFYGVRRTTSDIDILVKPSFENGRNVIDALLSLHLELEDIVAEDFEKELYLSFGGIDDAVDLMNFTPAINFETAYLNSVVQKDGDLTFRIIHYYDLIMNKTALKRSGNKSLIDTYDVSELKRILNIE